MTRIFKDEEIAIPANESEIHARWGPEDSDFSFERRISILALPVGGKVDGGGQFPFPGWICRIQLDVASHPGSNDFGSGGHSQNEHSAEKLV